MKVSSEEIETIYEFIAVLADLHYTAKAGIFMESDVTSILRPYALLICRLNIEAYVSVLEKYGWEPSEFTGPLGVLSLSSIQKDVEACFQERISND